MPKGPHWTKEQEEYVARNMHRMSDEEMGKHLARSEVAIAARRRIIQKRMCATDGKQNQHWSDNDVKRLKAMWREGIEIPQIAKELKRTNGGVRKMAQRVFGSLSRVEEYPNQRQPWSEADDEFLVDGIKEGMGVNELAKSLGRTPGSLSIRHYNLTGKHIEGVRDMGRFPTGITKKRPTTVSVNRDEVQPKLVEDTWTPHNGANGYNGHNGANGHAPTPVSAPTLPATPPAEVTAAAEVFLAMTPGDAMTAMTPEVYVQLLNVCMWVRQVSR